MNITDLNFIQEMVVANPALMWAILAWTIIWKGISLWKASQRKEKVWFIVLLVLNTMGILDILYVFVFSELKKKSQNVEAPKE